MGPDLNIGVNWSTFRHSENVLTQIKLLNKV